jgi:hypothetical protein
MLMVSGVPLALLPTDTASHRAGFDDRPDDEEIDCRLASHDSAGRLAGVSAVEAQPDATDQLLDVFLTEGGVGATDTGSGTVEAGFDAAQEHLAIEAARLRMHLDDLANRHVISS